MRRDERLGAGQKEHRVGANAGGGGGNKGDCGIMQVPDRITDVLIPLVGSCRWRLLTHAAGSVTRKRNARGRTSQLCSGFLDRWHGVVEGEKPAKLRRMHVLGILHGCTTWCSARSTD